jgi:hypothetical protein
VKTAAFTLHADARQSARWKQSAEAEGFASVGRWAACALDAYLKARARAGMPLPLAWHWGHFSVTLDGGETVTVKGHVSPPFATFAGTEAGPLFYAGSRRFVLVYAPRQRILATLRSFRACQQLASELSRAWVRWGGSEPSEDPGPILARHHREDL